MRIALALVLASSCAAPPCTLSECAGACPDVAMASELVLQPWQAGVIQADLDDLRGGLQFQGGPSMCAIDSECRSGALPSDEELGEDPVDLYVTYRTPKAARTGDWTGKFKMWCADVIPLAKEALERPNTGEADITVEATQGEWKTWLFHRIQFLPLSTPQRCAWALELANPDGQTAKVEGRYLRAAHIDPIDRSAGFAADAGTPGVTVVNGPSPTEP
jgi:hypothetical protein